MVGVWAALAALGMGIGRALYARHTERRALRLRPLGPGGVVVGAERIELPRGGSRGLAAVLLLHGAGDTPQVLAGLAAHLRAAGFAVVVPLLPGHGRQLSALTRVSAQAWTGAARQEYDTLRATHDWVGVVGLSMGGALAIELALDHSDVPAVVLLSPFLSMTPALRFAAATSRFWGPIYPYFSSRGERSIRDAAAAASARGHGVFTPAALRALYAVVKSASARLSELRCPVLMIQSSGDNRIPASAAAQTFARIGSGDKELVWIEGAGHVISVDYGHERVFALATDWLRRHSTSVRTPAPSALDR